MHVDVKQSMTAATALLAAGAITISPVIAQAPEALRAAHADVSLVASPNPIAALEGFAESGLRLAQGLALLPLAPIAAALAVADGDTQAFYNAIRQVIDAPLWVIDPALGINQTNLTGKGLAALFPDQADDIQAFRNDVLWAATNQFRSSIADFLGVADTSTPLDVLTPLAGFAAGIADSGFRLAQGLVLAPLAPLNAIMEIAGGVEPNVAVFNMLDSFISAPLWVADPFMGTGPANQVTPIGLKALLPNRADGIQEFRNDVLWKATDDVREFVREALGVPAVTSTTSLADDVAKPPAPSSFVTLDVATTSQADSPEPPETVMKPEVEKAPAIEKAPEVEKAPEIQKPKRNLVRPSLTFGKTRSETTPAATKPGAPDLNDLKERVAKKLGLRGGQDSTTPAAEAGADKPSDDSSDQD